MSNGQVKLRWSKKEQDWLINYESHSGKCVGGAFFGLIQEFEKFMSKSWDGQPTGFTTFRQYLIDGGFDPDSFTISVNPQK